MLSAFAEGRLFGERSGDGPARVLALPGWGRTRRDFAATLASLPAVALDLPGFGSTPAPPEAWGSAEYADLVAEATAELVAGLPRAPGATAVPGMASAVPGMVVLGHSFGGCVAVQLAARRPELVASLVLSGVPRLVRATAAARPPALSYRAVRTLRRAGLVSEARLEAARRRHGSPDYRNAEGMMRDVLVRVLAENLESQATGLACPVRLVWGEDDTAAPVGAARRLAGLLPVAELTVLPGVDHMVPSHAPEALRAAVEAALAEVDRAPGTGAARPACS